MENNDDFKRHKCTGCGSVRQERFMCMDVVYYTKKGKKKIQWQCGDCEEENRGGGLNAKRKL